MMGHAGFTIHEIATPHMRPAQYAWLHAQEQIWALQEQLRLRDYAIAQDKATAVSQAKGVETKLADLASQLARVQSSCTASHGAMTPCLPVSYQPEFKQPGKCSKSQPYLYHCLAHPRLYSDSPDACTTGKSLPSAAFHSTNSDEI